MRPIVVANWKMNGSLDLLSSMIANLAVIEELNSVEIVICPPNIFLSQAIQIIQGTKIKVGAQNCYFLDNGAYTGEISTSMLQQLGVEYVITGHSERRELFFESDTDVLKKVLSAQQHGLIPVICIGESLQDREKQQTFNVIDRQLKVILEQADFSDPTRIVIAYEPIWAIGTGKTASPQQAEQAHRYISSKLPAGVRVIYGGSLKPANVDALFEGKNIAGGLVGGAALQIKDFVAICQSARRVFG